MTTVFLKSVQGGTIRTLFEVLKEIVHDVNLVFDPTGVRLLTMDGARCALIHLKLRADAFEQYRCDGTFRAGVNMNNVFKLVRTLGSHDTFSMYVDPAASDELGIVIHNADQNSVTDFKLKLLDVDEENIRLPDVAFDSVITLPSAYLQRMCRDMLNIASVIEISCHGGTVRLGCAGDFARQETVIGETDAGMTVASASDKRVDGRFSLKYMHLFCKASSLCNTAELLLKEDFPMILKYNVASLGEIRFCLAQQLDD